MTTDLNPDAFGGNLFLHRAAELVADGKRHAYDPEGVRLRAELAVVYVALAQHVPTAQSEEHSIRAIQAAESARACLLQGVYLQAAAEAARARTQLLLAVLPGAEQH